ncbi:MAG TPA: flagellar basal body P-ring formation chaperone FlgA [Xanthobacteraceae bacterium]|nr:flagellar basal body P-ring formation chaperone FlgA [Xanthobacteraceae bacterium]
MILTMIRAKTSAVIRPAAIALVIGVVAATPAAAEEAAPAPMPTLKRVVTVSDDLVRIGDMIDNAGDAAATPIFRSPDAGTTGRVTLQQVIDAIRPYHLHQLDTQGIATVEVTRTGRTIDATEIEASIARTFAGRYGFGEAKNLRVTLDGIVQPITIDPSATTDLSLVGASLDPRSGRFDVSFEVPGNRAMRRVPLRLTGTIVETVATAVLAQALARGDVVKAADLTIERRPKAEVTGEPITTVEDAVGLAVRQQMRAGQVLVRGQLMKPELVHRDDNVTLVYEVPGILLTTRGKALEAGAMGDTITVTNIETKRTVQGTVSGPSRVTIVSTTVRAGAATLQSVASR